MRGRGPGTKVEQIVRACGEYPKDKKECGSLAVIYATLGCSAGSCLNSCGEIKTNPQQHRCHRPPTSVATFCEHLCQQNVARQFGRSEVSFNSRRPVAKSKAWKAKFARIYSPKAATPSPTSKLQSQIRSLPASLRLRYPISSAE